METKVIKNMENTVEASEYSDKEVLSAFQCLDMLENARCKIDALSVLADTHMEKIGDTNFAGRVRAGFFEMFDDISSDIEEAMSGLRPHLRGVNQGGRHGN